MGKKISANWIGGNEGKFLEFSALCCGLKRSFWCTMLGLLFLSAGISISEAQMFYLSDWVTLIIGASVLFGGLRAGIVAGMNGWFHGLVVAFGYYFCQLLLAFTFLPAGFAWSGLLRQAFVLILLGSLGGILGVNLKDYQQRQQLRKERIKASFWTYHKNSR